MHDPGLILVAASLARGRDAAFNRGLSLALQSGAQLYVLHAVPTPASRGATARVEIRRELVERAQRAGVTVQAVEQQGDPAEIIELHANARDVDLIVIGADRTPRSNWARRRSVAERLLRHTSRPTLVVPMDDTATSGYAHAVIGLDLSVESGSIIQQIRALFTSHLPRMTLVHAVKGLESAAAVQSPARWTIPEYRTYAIEDARRRLKEILVEIPGIVHPGLQVATGSAAAAIVTQAAAIDADLIVVGSSRRFTPLGSTARRVLSHSKRALLVIPVVGARRRSALTEQDRRAA